MTRGGRRTVAGTLAGGGAGGAPGRRGGLGRRDLHGRGLGRQHGHRLDGPERGRRRGPARPGAAPRGPPAWPAPRPAAARSRPRRGRPPRGSARTPPGDPRKDRSRSRSISPSKTSAFTSLEAESAEMVGFRITASPMELLMKRVRRPGIPAGLVLERRDPEVRLEEEDADERRSGQQEELGPAHPTPRRRLLAASGRPTSGRRAGPPAWRGPWWRAPSSRPARPAPARSPARPTRAARTSSPG